MLAARSQPDEVPDPLVPCLYEGRLFHRRADGPGHAFSYRLFFAFLDIDRLPELCAASGVVRYNAPGLVSFDERDHLGDPRRSLRERLAEDAGRRGVTMPEGPVFLLTHLRQLGYCFNPASIFFCCDRGGRPVTCCVEVSNHFGERRPYWVGEGTPSPFDEEGVAHHAKDMHVSPFLPVSGSYAFRTTRPGAKLSVHIDQVRSDGAICLETGLELSRTPWSREEVRRMVRRFPRMPIDVALWIYREAAALLRKGASLHWHPSGKLPRMPLP